MMLRGTELFLCIPPSHPTPPAGCGPTPPALQLGCFDPFPSRFPDNAGLPPPQPQTKGSAGAAGAGGTPRAPPAEGSLSHPSRIPACANCPPGTSGLSYSHLLAVLAPKSKACVLKELGRDGQPKARAHPPMVPTSPSTSSSFISPRCPHQPPTAPSIPTGPAGPY